MNVDNQRSQSKGSRGERIKRIEGYERIKVVKGEKKEQNKYSNMQVSSDLLMMKCSGFEAIHRLPKWDTQSCDIYHVTQPCVIKTKNTVTKDEKDEEKKEKQGKRTIYSLSSISASLPKLNLFSSLSKQYLMKMKRESSPFSETAALAGFVDSEPGHSVVRPRGAIVGRRWRC